MQKSNKAYLVKCEFWKREDDTMNYISWTATVHLGKYSLHYTKSEDYFPQQAGARMKINGSQGLCFYMWKASTLNPASILYLTQVHRENTNSPTMLSEILLYNKPYLMILNNDGLLFLTIL